MAFVKVWRRENNQKLTSQNIEQIMGHSTYQHQQYEQSLYFHLKLKNVRHSTDSAEYLVHPWDVCWNTLKCSLFMEYFHSFGVNDWNHLIPSSSNCNTSKPLKPPSTKRRRIEKETKSVSPMTSDTVSCDTHSEARMYLNQKPVIPQQTVENASSNSLSDEIQRVHQLLSTHSGSMTLDYMLQNCHLLNHLMNECNMFQFQLDEQLKEKKKNVVDSSFEFINLSNVMNNYRIKMNKYDAEIRSYDEMIKKLIEDKATLIKKQQEVEKEIDEVNDKLMNNARAGMELRKNTEESKYELELLALEKQKTETLSHSLLNEIESVPISKWSKINVMDWILCICDGHFSQYKFQTFIRILHQTDAICDQFGRKMDRFWLKSCGLCEHEDISILMSNHLRLINKQI